MTLMIFPETRHLCIYTHFKSTISGRNQPDWPPSAALPEMPARMATPTPLKRAAGERVWDRCVVLGAQGIRRQTEVGPSCHWKWRHGARRGEGIMPQGESSASGGTWPRVLAQGSPGPQAACHQQPRAQATAALQGQRGDAAWVQEEMPGLHAADSHPPPHVGIAHGCPVSSGAQKVIANCRTEPLCRPHPAVPQR